MSIQKRTRGGRVDYMVRWRDGGATGPQRSRSFDRRADAEAFEATRRRRKQLGAHAPIDPSRRTLGDWLETWVADGRARWARSTLYSRTSILDKWVDPYLGDVRLADLGRRRLIEYRREITAKGCTAKQANATMRVLSAALSAAADEELIPANPAHGIKRLPTIRTDMQALSADQAEAIRAALPTQADRVLWGFMYAAGLRPEEALPLRWRDVDTTNKRVMIDRTFVVGQLRNTTKTGLGRDVDLIDPLIADLTALRAEQHPVNDDALVCPSLAGTPHHLENWRARVWNPARDRVGPGWATPYAGRRTYISLRIHAGDSPLVVAAAVGHTNGETIWRHYAREFERARTATPVPLAHAVETARRALASPGSVRQVCAKPGPGPSRGHLRLVV